MNQKVLGYLGVKLEKRQEYAVDYVCGLLEKYKEATAWMNTHLFPAAGIGRASGKSNTRSCRNILNA